MTEMFHATVIALAIYGVLSYYRIKRENALLRSMIEDQWATIDRLQKVWAGVVDSGMVKQGSFFDLKDDSDHPVFTPQRIRPTVQYVPSGNGVQYAFDPNEIRKAIASEDSGDPLVFVERSYYSGKGRPTVNNMWVPESEVRTAWTNTADGRQYRDKKIKLVEVVNN